MRTCFRQIYSTDGRVQSGGLWVCLSFQEQEFGSISDWTSIDMQNIEQELSSMNRPQMK